MPLASEDFDDDEAVEIFAVETEESAKQPLAKAPRRTRASCMTFNVANVAKPLAAAGKIVEAGNRVVLDAKGSYVEHVATGERMKLRKEKGVYVFDVVFEDDDQASITLDSGAGVNVWPKEMKKQIKMEPKQEGLKMIAANGTVIEHVCTKKIRFQGIAPEQAHQQHAQPTFQWQSR